MPPPIRIRSALSSRFAMTASLSDGLAPPSTTTYGRAGSCGQLLQHGDLGLDQFPGRVRQQRGQVVDAGVLAVQRAEAVAHVHLGQRGQPPGQLGPDGVVLAGLGRLEPDVLQHAPRHRRPGRPRPRAAESPATSRRPAVPARPQQLGQPGRDRRERRAAGRPVGVAVALRPPEVGDDQHPGAAFPQLVDRRQAGPDAAVVGDRGAVQRHVQVGPQQHDLARDVERVDALHDRAGRLDPTRAARSASRLE